MLLNYNYYEIQELLVLELQLQAFRIYTVLQFLFFCICRVTLKNEKVGDIMCSVLNNAKIPQVPF